jgi:hypothetical protein
MIKIQEEIMDFGMIESLRMDEEYLFDEFDQQEYC